MNINGSLVLNTDGSGQIKNAYVERGAYGSGGGSLPSMSSNPGGRIVFNTDDNLFYYWSGASWQQVANASEAGVVSIAAGTGIGITGSGSGPYTGAVTVTNDGVTSAVAGSGISVSSATGDVTFTNSGVTSISAGTTGLSVSSSTGSVTLSGTLSAANGGTGISSYTAGNLLYASGTTALSKLAPGSSTQVLHGGTTPSWAAVALASDVSGVLPLANGGTNASTAAGAWTNLVPVASDSHSPAAGDMLVYNGTSGAWDVLAVGSAGQVLTSNTGSVYGVSWNTPTSGTVTSVNISTTSSGVTVGGGPITSSGTLTVNINSELQALSGLASTGFVVRTAAATYAERSITGSSGRIVVTNGDGVTSSPTIDLATVIDAGTGTFLKFTTDSYGRVAGTTAVVTSDITALVDSTYVNVTGDSMTGNLTFDGTHTVTGIPTPTNSSDATPKSYVDAAINGLSWKQAAAVTAGSSTNVSVSSAPATIDGYTLQANDRVLLIGQTTASQNGIYVFTAASSALTRATDAATYTELDDAAIFVIHGTSFGGSGYVQTGVVASDFTGQSWTVFSTGGAYTAGTGLTLTSHTFSVNMGAGIVELPTGEVGIDLYSTGAGALILTSNGSTSSTIDTAQLYLLLKSSGGLTQDSNGLYIPAAGVTNSMLANSSVTLDADSGTGSVALGGTLMVQGTSAQGITTAVTSGTYTISASDASTTQKGVAKFDTSYFTATSGNISWNTSANLTVASLIDSGLTAHGAVYANSSKTLASVALTNGQLLVGSTGADPVAATITAGTGVSVTNGSGSITVANTGVTSISTGTTGLSVSSSTGSVTISGTLSVANGGTGVTATGSDGHVLVASSSAFVSSAIQYTGTGDFSAGVDKAITHGLGIRLVMVQVYDSSYSQIIPNSIVLTDANTVTVNLSAALTGAYVVVTGVVGTPTGSF